MLTYAFFLFFFPAAVLFFAAGYGTRVAVLSLITVWTPEDLRARTFAIAQIVEHGGRMCADPLLLRIFGASLHLDGVWPGLPFLVAAVSCHTNSTPPCTCPATAAFGFVDSTSHS